MDPIEAIGRRERRSALPRLAGQPGTIDHTSALAGDPDLSALATGLEDRWTFVDLRDPQVGMGFAWGRHAPRTELRRHGYQRLFAHAPPERKPGLLGRRFARR